MARTNARLEAARTAYRQALDAAREHPTSEAWAKLLAAGKELSAAEQPKRSGRRPRRGAIASEQAIVEPMPLPEGSLDLDPTLD